MRVVRIRWLPIAILMFVSACQRSESDVQIDPMVSVDTLLPASEDYATRRVGTSDYPIPPQAKFLRGVKICLNPGHGGDAARRGFKRGPTGVREAEINLRVAQYLLAFLRAVEADVIMTRDADVSLSYEERAAIANEWGADLFVSLHHNAIDNKPNVNYTTVWYHGNVSYRPSNLDLARYLCDGLFDALALPRMTDVPLKTDLLMYKNGFAVLRHAKVTAALCESSFFTNPEEEQRLRRPDYNLREAYGLFIGLARYAAAGLPHARFLAPMTQESDNDQAVGDAVAGAMTAIDKSIANRSSLRFELYDGLRQRKAWGYDRCMILQDSIVARVNGQPATFQFQDTGEQYFLTVDIPTEISGPTYAVELQFQNMNKNSILNPHFVISKGQAAGGVYGDMQ